MAERDGGDPFEFVARPAPDGMSFKARNRWNHAERLRAGTNINNAKAQHSIEQEIGASHRNYQCSLEQAAQKRHAEAGING